jgi:hypothetical protein
VAKILKSRAKSSDEVHVFLGDFNIVNRDDAGMKALSSNGFHVPDIGPTSVTGTKHYDQIAFTSLKKKTRMLESGVIQFDQAVFMEDEASDYQEVARQIRNAKTNGELSLALQGRFPAGEAYPDWPREFKKWRTHEMSDHLPIWLELEVDYSNEYLREISNLAST